MADIYTEIARASFEAYVRNAERISLPDGLPDELARERGACFVSLHIDDALRGCIGTLEPVRPTLADEIVDNAISACSRDPRFLPVAADELPLIHCSVDVLFAPEPIASPSELDPKRFGVIVRSGMRRGVLLPDLEGVDTVDEQVRIACMKAGIAVGEPVELSRFEVVRHSE